MGNELWQFFLSEKYWYTLYEIREKQAIAIIRNGIKINNNCDWYPAIAITVQIVPIANSIESVSISKEYEELVVLAEYIFTLIF